MYAREVNFYVSHEPVHLRPEERARREQCNECVSDEGLIRAHIISLRARLHEHNNPKKHNFQLFATFIARTYKTGA